jgi:hypothetical protein
MKPAQTGSASTAIVGGGWLKLPPGQVTMTPR